jgi:hypothetical protein
MVDFLAPIQNRWTSLSLTFDFFFSVGRTQIQELGI